MKKSLIASALIALSMAASGNALAQRGDHGNGHQGYNSRAQQHDDVRHDGQRGQAYGRHDGQRSHGYDSHDGPRGQGYDRREARRDDNARNYYRDDSRGGGPRHNLRRGQRLDREYRDNRYVASDWRARRLSAPPRGHHWVRAGNDYVLAAIATGVIAHILFNN